MDRDTPFKKDPVIDLEPFKEDVAIPIVEEPKKVMSYQERGRMGGRPKGWHGKRKVKPTIKQIRTLQYLQQGMSRRQAMLKAGYAKNTAHVGKVNQFNGFKQLVYRMPELLQKAGLTDDYMVDKFKEWLEATKMHTSPTEPDRNVPDYQVQLKAFDRWKELMQPKLNNTTIKRKLTIEEYVLGDKTEKGEE